LMARRRRRRHIVPGSEAAMDDFKHEVARELGLDDEIRERGWAEMTTRDAGLVGGHMVRRMVESAEERLADRSRNRRR